MTSVEELEPKNAVGVRNAADEATAKDMVAAQALLPVRIGVQASMAAEWVKAAGAGKAKAGVEARKPLAVRVLAAGMKVSGALAKVSEVMDVHASMKAKAGIKVPAASA